MASASTASRDNAVLVLVDAQERLAAVMERQEPVLERMSFLISVAAIVGIPVVVTRQYPKGLGDLCAGVANALADATESGLHVAYADKLTFDCFREPEFVRELESTGRRQIVLCGMESHICVCQTALAALRNGYEVHVAEDACCSRDENAHSVATSRMAHAGAAVTLSESIAYELVEQAGTPDFKRLLAVVKRV